MAKPKPTADAVVDPLDPPSEPDAPITVDLDEKTPPPAAPTADELAKQLDAFQHKYDASLKAMENQLAASRRINERLQRELGQRPVPSPAPPANAEPADELDRLVEQGQWKQAVAQLAQQEAARLYQAREAERQQQERHLQRQMRLETSKQKVISLYPELDPETGDPESTFHKTYIEVLNANSDMLDEPRGPELAMYEMETRLAGQGVSPRSFKVPAAKPSSDPRHPPANPTALPPGRPSGGTNTFVLTKEQKAIAEQNNIPLEQYAKIAKSLEAGEEVTI